MPTLTFDVESYSVITTQTGTGTGGAWRMLSLTSAALAHGIRNRASVYFFEAGSTTLGVVTNVDQPNFQGLSVYAYCRKADYHDWYDLLRNEAPLKFSAGYEGPDFDPSKPSRPLYWVQLYTGQPEPPGEGAEAQQKLTLPISILEVLSAQ
jgi:hypothetical protein